MSKTLHVFSLFGLLVFPVVTRGDSLTPDQLSFFESKIRPVLVTECYSCHSNETGNARGGLRLDTKQLTLIGGSSGPAIVPGDLDESLLWNAINHEDFAMPPKRKLPTSVLDDFRVWIEMGAPDPRETEIAKIKSSITDEDILEAKQNFWAYQKPVNVDPPSVAHTAWPRTDVDRFILAELEAAGLQPADDAPAHKVLRRLCFDLIGLPPTPAQISSFNKRWKADPDAAVDAVVDALLDQKQFGERWGRHWLDVARYAESTGREVNMTYPHAWRYRDYVIDSFNDDKPFDRFVQEQIAGDLLPAKTDQQWTENLIATTFLAVGPKNVNEQNRTQFEADLIDEQIDATTRVFLGTSVACARCHDHKFDPIPQTDYYALAGIFRSMTTYFGNPPSDFGTFNGVQARRSSSLLLLPVEDPNPFDKRYSSQELAELRAEITDKLNEQREFNRNLRQNRNANANANRDRIRLLNEISARSAKLAVVDEDGKPLSYCMGVQDSKSPQNARVLVRGEIDQPGPIVDRGFPKILCDDVPVMGADSSGRLQLARWIGSDENPLTARVMVNRIWQQLIGQGIVTSTENFGTTGAPPSHPELLDHLATRFVESGWSIKTMIREIATSRVYRLSSQHNEKHFQYDPDNALVWRANSRRLDAEAIRDAMLSIGGQIDLDRPRGSEVAKAGYSRVRDGMLGDPRELVRQQIMQQRNRGFRGRLQRPNMAAYGDVIRKARNGLDMEDATCRSVYLPIVRDEVPRSLEVFDFADANSVIGTREASNTANQALYLMNNRFVIQQSESLSKRIAKEYPRAGDQLEATFLLVYGRPPTSGERAAIGSFSRAFEPAGNRSQEQELFTVVCQSLFASAEFRYLD